MKKIINKNVFLAKSKIQGYGVFAKRNIKKGEVVIVWHPKKILQAEDIKKLSNYEQNRITQTANHKYILMGIPERYINHCCNPKTFIRDKKDIAIKNIKKGEEITSDYCFNSNDTWSFGCHCGSKKCRKKIIGSFFSLPKKIQKQYLPYLDNWFKKEYKEEIAKILKRVKKH